MMPLFTYVMSYNGKTQVAQFSSSNFTGFLLNPISAAFPELKPSFGELMRMRPDPVKGAAYTWHCSQDISGSSFEMRIVETRQK
jgi:hypothetical protein